MFGSLNLSPQIVNLTIDEENDLLKNVVNFLGHRRRNKYAFPLLITLYSFVFATGLTGNLCTCITIWKSRDMHTPTNFYLFSLAISDLLLITLGLSVEMYNIYESWPWIFGETFCIFRTVVLEIVTSASILTVLCFTIERYLAICFPIISQKILGGLNRAIKIIMIVWFLSFLLAVPYTFTSGVFLSVKSELRNISIEIIDSQICAIYPKYWEPMLYYMAVTTCLVFLIPIFVISVLYILIGITLYKTSDDRRLNKTEHVIVDHHGRQHVFFRQNTTSIRHSRRAVLKMLVAVVIAFFICWAPFHFQRLTAFLTRLLDKTNSNLTSETLTKFQEILFFTSGILYYLSATVNPVLYNIMSKRYRNSFKRTLCRWKKPRRNILYTPRLIPSQYHLRMTNSQKPKVNHYYRENILTFSMSKYRFIIGSRTNFHGKFLFKQKTSFHCRLAFIEKQEREQEKQQMKLQLQQRKFSLSVIQQQNKHRANLIFKTNLLPLTPPNSSISDSKIAHHYK